MSPHTHAPTHPTSHLHSPHLLPQVLLVSELAEKESNGERHDGQDERPQGSVGLVADTEPTRQGGLRGILVPSVTIVCFVEGGVGIVDVERIHHGVGLVAGLCAGVGEV